MKLYFSPASPFARKVLVVAHEAGMADRIEILGSKASPVATDMTIAASNPLGQVPSVLLPDGQPLHDSRVICEYLDSLAGAGLFPAGEARWPVLTLQSLADGILDAALLARYETALRPEPLRWKAWEDGQMRKIQRGLDQLDAEAGGFVDRVDIATIAIGCALGYLDFRFPHFDWRGGRDRLDAWYAGFAQRPSMQATQPKG
ncbi:MAG: glutathione S-transferase [Oceanospirillaceae bacterium]|nr:glutathione S-transferase [Oceanospirillaceae bacterium]